MDKLQMIAPLFYYVIAFLDYIDKDYNKCICNALFGILLTLFFIYIKMK